MPSTFDRTAGVTRRSLRLAAVSVPAVFVAAYGPLSFRDPDRERSADDPTGGPHTP